MSMSNRHDRPPVIFLMGPTASGKTGLAAELHEKFPLDIISVDSALVYCGMDIGTAKPDEAFLARAPHRLINLLEPNENYSAADFREDALIEMSRIHGAGRVPLLVGGTLLYFRALSGGLAELPPASPLLRKRLEKQAASRGWPAMHRLLNERDPEAARRIHPNDPQRIQRALEVIEITGHKLSDLQRQHRQQQEQQSRFRILRLVVCPQQRSVLHQRIEQRFDAMLEQGFMDEMQVLYQRPDIHRDMPAMRCVGYRQAWSYLEGEISFDEMRLQAIAATRQLAKRQLTWLRQETSAIWYDLDAGSTRESVFEEVAGFLE